MHFPGQKLSRIYKSLHQLKLSLQGLLEMKERKCLIKPTVPQIWSTQLIRRKSLQSHTWRWTLLWLAYQRRYSTWVLPEILRNCSWLDNKTQVTTTWQPEFFNQVHSSIAFDPDPSKTLHFVHTLLNRLRKQNKKERKKENSMLWNAYSVGTLYFGYLFDKNLASSGTDVLIGQHIYRPEADSFSAKNMWARQTSSTCAIEIDPESICMPFIPLIKNSLPTKPIN